jgi:PKD repeat protein
MKIKLLIYNCIQLWLRLIAGLILLFLAEIHAFSQTDNEFWFVAPELTVSHEEKPILFVFTTTDLPAKITIQQPAVTNPADPYYTFRVDTVINLPAFSTYAWDVTYHRTALENVYDNKVGLPGIPIPGKSNKGVHITSDNLITCYYTENGSFNPDIYALKGKNSLGTDFFASFQTDLYNMYKTFAVPAYSAFDIVFTEDNTYITLDIPAGKRIFNGTTTSAYTGTVVLGPFNKGETYSGIPSRFGATAPQCTGWGAVDKFFSRSGPDHLAGVRIRTNGKKIAITLKDDSLKSFSGGSYNEAGDQTVPVTIIGTEYIAMRGQLTYSAPNLTYYCSPPVIPNPVSQERIYILATQNGTDVYIQGVKINAVPLNMGQQVSYAFPAAVPFVHVQTTNPTYCWQITGFGNEVGGAILPPTNICTGSTQVGFARGSSEPFYLNIMVRQNAKGGFLFNGHKSNYLKASNFTDVPGTSWSVGRIGPIPDVDSLAKTMKAARISNTIDVFHVGVINGGAASGCRYGYFSDYNPLKVSAFITESGSSDIRLCNGASAQIVARGGIFYKWKPSAYLSDTTSPIPIATPPTSIAYTAYVSGACNQVDSTIISIEVAPPFHLSYTIDTTFGCAPLKVKIHDRSNGIHKYIWDFGDGQKVSWLTYDAKQNDTIFFHTYNNNSRPVKKYTLRMIGENSYQCRDTVDRLEIINPKVTSLFSVLPDTINCHPLIASFTNNSLNADFYQWEFGDGASSSDTIPTHTFNNFNQSDVTYTTKLTTRSVYGCTAVSTHKVLIHPYLKADFAVTPAQGCAPYSITITNNSLGGAGISRYEWNFGDGSPLSSFSAKQFGHTYQNNSDSTQIRNLQLVIENGPGCLDTMIRPITIFPSVHAQFTEDKTIGCNPMTVKFTHPVNTVPVTYTWDFGDGSSSSLADPVNSFINSGRFDTIFKTRLIVTSQNLCIDSLIRNITVHPYINADFSVDKSAGCAPFKVNITNNSISHPGISNYEWIFGDGNTVISIAPSLSHIYQNISNSTVTFNLQLVVHNLSGCTDTMKVPISVYPQVLASFTTDFNSGCNSLTVNFTNTSNKPVANAYSWEFGDGVSDNQESPQHIYSNAIFRDTFYTVKLISVSSDLCSDTFTAPIKVWAYIKSDFDIETPMGCSPFAVSLVNNSTGGINNYVWDFKDGSSTSTLITPTHTFTNKTTSAMSFGIQLVVKNSHGCADTAIRNITVYPEVVTAFVADITAGCNPLTVNFSNQSNSVATKFNWDFGDASNAGDINPSHVYYNLGPSDSVHAVHLHATSDNLCAQDYTLNIKTYAFIQADFKVNTSQVCSGVSIVFTNTSTGGVAQSSWDFEGDNVTDLVSNNQNINHIYNNLNSNPVINNARLIVQNGHSCYDTISHPVTIYPKVTANFDYDTAGCQPFTVSLINHTLEGNATMGNTANYDWYFGDGGTAGSENPQKTYFNYTEFDTSFIISLVAISPFLCKDSISHIVGVYHVPKAMISVDKTIECSPFKIEILNNSITSGSTYLWDFGDGAAATTLNKDSISHTFINNTAAIKDFNINMQAVTPHGCADKASITLSAYPLVSAGFTYDSTGCSPLTSSFKNTSRNADYYSWDFNDGTVSTQKDPANRFINTGSGDAYYNVKLISKSQYNCIDSVAQTVRVFGQPYAEFVLSPEVQIFKSPDADVTFTNETNLQTDWWYTWSFGDSTISFSRQSSFDKNYSTWGANRLNNEIKVTLMAYNVLHQQCADTVSHTLRIIPPKPEIDISNNNPNGCEPYTVNFSIDYAYIYEDSVFWDFNDGSFTREKSPTHTFPSAGYYNVKVIVIGDGGSRSAYKPVTVHPNPTAKFEWDPKVAYLPDQKVNLYNLSKGASAYLWDFGDGTTSDEAEPSHQYAKLGNYNIKLVVYSDYDCKDSAIQFKAVIIEGDGMLEFPNAFTPNISGPTGGDYSGLVGSRINDIFYPVHRGIESYHLEIFTRWGERIFESDDVKIGWDGYFKGQLCKQEVYVWKVKAKFYNGQDYIKAGDVTLIQKLKN